MWSATSPGRTSGPSSTPPPARSPGGATTSASSCGSGTSAVRMPATCGRGLVDGDGRIASAVVDVGSAVPPSLASGMTVVVATGPLPVPESLSVHGSWTDEAGVHDDEPLGPWRYP